MTVSDNNTRRLDLSNNPLRELPPVLQRLQHLHTLAAHDCAQLQGVTPLPAGLRVLDIRRLRGWTGLAFSGTDVRVMY